MGFGSTWKFAKKGKAKEHGVRADLGPPLAVEIAEVFVLEGLADFDDPICAEVEDHHCVSILQGEEQGSQLRRSNGCLRVT